MSDHMALQAAGCPDHLHDFALAQGVDLSTLLQLWQQLKAAGASVAPGLRVVLPILASVVPAAAPFVAVALQVLAFLYPAA